MRSSSTTPGVPAARPPFRAVLTAAAVATLLVAVGWDPGVAQQPTHEGAPQHAAAAADVASPEAIVKALYETVTRRPGEDFDWDRERTLFLPGARLIPNTEQSGGEFRVLTVDAFIAWVDEHTVVGGADDEGFEEREVATVIERYGDIAHAFSTYEKGFYGLPEVLGRGINSIQMVHHDGRWWITQIAWDEESGAGPLPERYRPRE